MEVARRVSVFANNWLGDKPKTPLVAHLIVNLLRVGIASSNLLYRLVGVPSLSNYWVPSVQAIRVGYLASMALFGPLSRAQLVEYCGVASMHELAEQIAEHLDALGGIDNASDPADLRAPSSPYEQRRLLARPLSLLEVVAMLRANDVAISGIARNIRYSPFTREDGGATITRKGTVPGPPECTLDVDKFITVLREAKYRYGGRPHLLGCSAHIRALALYLASSSDVLSRTELRRVLLETRAKELHHTVDIAVEYDDVWLCTVSNFVGVVDDGAETYLSSDEGITARTKALDMVGDRLYRDAPERRETRQNTEHNAPTVPPGLPRVEKVVTVGGVEVIRPGVVRSWMFVPDVGVVKAVEAGTLSRVFIEFRGGKIRMRQGNAFIRAIARVSHNFNVRFKWKAEVEVAQGNGAHYRDIGKVELQWLLQGSFGHAGIALGLKLLHDNDDRFRCDRSYSLAKSGWFLDRRELIQAEIPLQMLHGVMVLAEEHHRFILLPMQHTDKMLRMWLAENNLHCDYVSATFGKLGKLRILPGESRFVS